MKKKSIFKKNRKLYTFALLSVLGITMAGSGTVLAAGFPWGDLNPQDVASHQDTMFEHQAEILGLDVEIIKQGWAEGKNLREIAKANGVSVEAMQTKMQEERKDRMKEHLQILVDQGIITQAQADSRLIFMESRGEKGISERGEHRKGGMMGLGLGMGFTHNRDEDSGE